MTSSEYIPTNSSRSTRFSKSTSPAMNAEAIVDHRKMPQAVAVEAIHRQHHVRGIERMHQVRDDAIHRDTPFASGIRILRTASEFRGRNPIFTLGKEIWRPGNDFRASQNDSPPEPLHFEIVPEPYLCETWTSET